MRSIAFWNSVEPNPPDPRSGEHRFDWRETDRIAEDLARNRLRWNVLLGLSTSWGAALPGATFGPPQVTPFAAYAKAFARRYGRRGVFWQARPELSYAPVVSYEVWNEPNLLTFWPPRPEPARYADLYLAVRRAVHDVDRHARVVIGALANSTPDSNDASAFLIRMFDARPGLRGNVDAVGLTVYTPTAEQTLLRVAAARATLDSLGERTTPIDLNETGWTSAGVLPFTVAPVTEQERVARFSRLTTLLAGSDCGIATVMPYAWVTGEDNPADQSDWFGLAHRADASLRPAGAAYVEGIRDAMRAPPRANAFSVCDRPDLPPLVRSFPVASEPFRIRLVRRCSSRQLRITLVGGSDPEPYERFELNLPGGARHTLTDRDNGGPARAPSSTRIRLPSFGGRVRATAFDELQRVRARASARLARCSQRSGSTQS